MLGKTENTDAAKATLADDAQIIVIVDSRTGEVRQCGNMSGHCITTNPWANKLGPQQGVPISLNAHAADLERQAEQQSEATAGEPANEPVKAR